MKQERTGGIRCSAWLGITSTRSHVINTNRLGDANGPTTPDCNETVNAVGIRCSALLGQFNFAWCIMYLRNGGERIRAIMLARDALGITLTQAREWVDSVKLNRKLVSMEAHRKMHDEYPGGISEDQLRDYLEYEVSHWPNDPSSATRPTRAHDCNQSAMAGFAAAHG